MNDSLRNRGVLPRFLSFVVKRSGKVKPFKVPDDIIEAKTILFIDSGDLTDILFYTPLVNYFHKRFPSIKSVMLTEESHIAVVKGLMKVNVIISYRSDQLKIYKADYFALMNKVKEKNADAAILFQDGFSLERHLLASSSGARIRVGVSNPLSFPFINFEIRLSSNGYEGKKSEKVLNALGLKKEDMWSPPSLSPQDLNHARQLLHFRKPEKQVLTVGLDPGRSKTKHNIIPDVIAYLSNNLAGRRKVKFIVLTFPRLERLLNELLSKLKGEVIDLVPENLMETIAFISQCDLFISGNTDLFHYAAMLGTPTIGLFTRYDDARWIPEEMGNVRIIKGSKGEKLSLKDFFIKVEEVLSFKDS